MPPQEVLVCAKPSVARHMAGVLRSRGYSVETAADGVRAVETAERLNPDVVVIWADLRGPDTSGVVRRVQEASGAKVAVIVGKGALGRAAAFRDAGADAVLRDSRNVDRLARVVDRLLEGGLVEDALALPGDEAFEPEETVTNGSGVYDEPAGPAAEAPGVVTEPAEPGIDFQPCDVGEVVQDGAAEAARAYPAVVVQVTAPPRLPAVAHADALKGAVRALVEQACRDSDAGSNITVKAQRVDAGIFVLVSDRGPATGHEAAPDTGPISGVTLARALVALHGGILSVEPIPAGGRRASFTIPEHPPLLTGVELQGGFRALELLELAESAWRGEAPAAEAEPELLDQAIDQAIDQATAAADAAAHAPERPAEPEAPADPIRSLAALFGFDEEAAVEGFLDVESQVEPGAEEVELSPEVEPDLEALFAVEDVPTEAEPQEPPALEEELVEQLPPELEGVEVEAEKVDVEPVEVEPVEADAIDETEAEILEPEPVEPEPVEPEPAAVITLPPHDEEPALEPLLEDDPMEAPERVEVPEPVPATEAASPEPAPRVIPPKSFVPDPLHPATAILRALAEEYDTDWNRFRGR